MEKRTKPIKTRGLKKPDRGVAFFLIGISLLMWGHRADPFLSKLRERRKICSMSQLRNFALSTSGRDGGTSERGLTSRGQAVVRN